MRSHESPVLKDLVLLGGGHSHVTVMRRFGMQPAPGVRLTVIARDLHTPYSGMLPGFVAGHYGFDEIHIDLAPLARFAGARLYHDEAVGLDLANRRVLCRGRPPVAYDLLSIDTGSTPRLDVPGAAETAIAVKPIGRFIAKWEALCRRLLAAPGPIRVGIVGDGAGGIELLLAAQHRLGAMFRAAGSRQSPEFHLFGKSDDILPGFAAATRRRLRRILAARGVRLHLADPVVRVEPDRVHTVSGEVVALDGVLWVTPAAAPSWPAEAGLAVDERGFIAVDPTLRSVSHPEVFAAGDVAAVLEHPRPKAGVFAVRQGPPLYRNLRAALEGRPLRPFRPQREFLTIIGTGDGRAVASRNGIAVEGAWVWRWKDRIDRRFMRRYADLPEMRPASGRPATGDAPADATMRCGGCGAKVGSTVLTAALAALPPQPPRADVLIGLDASDDAAVVTVPAGKLVVHSVDYFRALIDDPYLFGRIAANHCLGDLYAMGAEPQTALAIATLPYGPEEKVRELLFQLMSGALATLDEAGAALAGGHTGEGAELGLGFSVNGIVDRDAVLTKGGMRPGDRLILTKAVGTGTLFAAAMQGKAKGRWLDAALASMIQSSRPAAECLRRHGVTACTDVTGFGLLGHLAEMAAASGTGARLRLDAVPLLDGAVETAAAGIVSTLHPQNLAFRGGLRVSEGSAADRRFPLLFDPQTAGGLLASVPADRTDACLDALRRLGYAAAAAIGEVVPGGAAPEPITLEP